MSDAPRAAPAAPAVGVGLGRPAQPLELEGWAGAIDGPTLASLRGRVVVVVAFQMLCPGCSTHALPQAARLTSVFDARDVAVIGLHSVFEHHGVQGTRAALEAFLHEQRLPFPVAIDARGADDDGGRAPLPRTMARYAMRGTPTLLLIDRQGRLRRQLLGGVADLALGASVATLVAG